MIAKLLVDTVVSEMKNYFKGSNGCFSETRDVFSARLHSYILETEKYLEAAVIGEIGNNTFDHNFGFNNDYPKGVYCNTAYEQKYAILADYGKGLRQSLLSVLPSIASDVEAIEIAFTKRISGRSPEQTLTRFPFVPATFRKSFW